jgi:hypothetical protein
VQVWDEDPDATVQKVKEGIRNQQAQHRWSDCTGDDGISSPNSQDQASRSD